jgi:hypothetical protein
MPGLQRDRRSTGRPAREARPQNLSATVQEVRRQGANNGTEVKPPAALALRRWFPRRIINGSVMGPAGYATSRRDHCGAEVTQTAARPLLVFRSRCS